MGVCVCVWGGGVGGGVVWCGGGGGGCLGVASQLCDCPASRTTLVATRFRVAVICPIIQVPHCIRVFFYFV